MFPQIVILLFFQLPILSTFCFTNLPFYKRAVSSTYHIMFNWHFDNFSFHINLPFHLLTDSSISNFTKSHLHQLAVSSSCCFTIFGQITVCCFHQLAILSTCGFANLQFLKFAVSSFFVISLIGHFAILQFRWFAVLSTCHFINLRFNQLTAALTYCFNQLVFLLNWHVFIPLLHWDTIYSTSLLVELPFCQLAILSAHGFIKILFYKTFFYLIVVLSTSPLSTCQIVNFP
jgi:hypothetical protein